MKAEFLSLRKVQVTAIALAVLSLVAVPMTKAQTGTYASVGYNPPQTQIQINPIQLPYTTTYPLTITSPSSLGGTLTVTLGRKLTTPDSKPASVSEATALGYVTFSGGDLNPDGTLTFSAAGQPKVVQVTVTFPLGTVSGSYGYKLFTDGWPAGFVVASSTNLGSDINASVSVNNVANPPTVVIGNPVDATEYTFSPANSYSVNFDFAANVDGTSPSPITGVTADVATTLGGVGSNVAIGATTGMNTTSVTGSGTLTVPSPGTYYLTVRATNSVGTATDTNRFVVKVNAPSPVVQITAPINDPDYAYFEGNSTPVVVPNSFTGTTGAGTAIQSFSVSLEPPKGPLRSSLSVSNAVGIGTQVATASTPLALTTPSGQYTLIVTASNQYATSQAATATFWINRVSNPVSQTINAFQSTSFSVTAQGRPSYTYQWYRVRGSAVPEILSNTAPYSGVTTATLSVTGATGGMSGDKYYCLITPLGGAGSIRSADAVLTVNKLPLTVTADNKSKVYGDPMPALTSTITGFANNQTLATSGVTGEPNHATSATALSQVATLPYVITPSLGTLAAENYYFTFANGALSVTKRPVTATVAVTKVYDGTLAVNYVGATGSLSNALSGDDVSVSFGSGGSYSDKNVGTGKAVTLPGLGLAGTKASNYFLTSFTATGAITTAPLTIAAKSYSIPAGAPVPNLEATYVGLVSGDTPNVVSGVDLSVTVPSGSPEGSYPITVSGGSAANYTITRVAGLLTITGSSGNVTVTGYVFLDLANFGTKDFGEVGLGPIKVRLYRGTSYVETETALDGSFSFFNVTPDTYELDVMEPAGLTHSVATPMVVSPTLGWSRNIGLCLDFKAIRGFKANGFTIGYWKNNIDKAIEGKAGGTQVSSKAIDDYTGLIKTLALSLWNDLDKARASSQLGSNSSQPVELLKKQLLASEYNYANGGYINGSQALTYAFIAWGECVAVNTGSTAATLIWAKDWFDAYNNSHGGTVNGPSL